jgi:hypothetical protein
MIAVIQHVPGARAQTMAALMAALPEAIVVECDGQPMETFRRTLIEAAHWHLEDDVILAPDFVARVRELVCAHGERVIRGFSTRHYCGLMPASSYLCNLCAYLPRGYGPMIAEFSRTWRRLANHPTGFDLVIRDWLVSRRERYWLASPSLVQHAHGRSLLGRRSMSRVSPTWSAAYAR